DLGRVSPAELTEIFREQTVSLLRGGVDCIIAETAQDLLELRSQIFGARRAMQETGRSVPVIAQITLDPSGRMLLGTEPLSAAAMIAACGADRRPPRPVPQLSSGLKAVALHQEPRPQISGERVNSQGSRKMKELLLANDIAGILAVAREQVEGGAHALDVCVALTERADE